MVVKINKLSYRLDGEKEKDMKKYEVRRNGKFYDGGDFNSIDSAIKSANMELESGTYELFEDGEFVGTLYVKSKRTVKKGK